MSISLRPSDASVGNQLLNDADVEISNCRFEMWNYDGKSLSSFPGILCDLTDLSSGDVHHNVFWSIGKPEDWAPSDNGEEIIPLGARSTPSASCNAMQFLASLVNNGFPEEDLEDGNITILNGLGFHAMRVEADVTRITNRDPNKRVPTYIIATQILYLPGKADAWAKKNKKSSPSSSEKQSGKRGSSKQEDVENESSDPSDDEIDAAMLLGTILKDHDGKIAKSDIPALVFKSAPKGSDKNKIVKLLKSDDFIEKFENFTSDAKFIYLND